MKTSRFISIGIILSAALLFTQCEIQKHGCTDPSAINYDVSADEDDQSCIYGVDIDGDNCEASLVGNLSITNETDETLLLYKNNEYVQCIPGNKEGFIINIPNSNLNIVKLQIWKASNVSDKKNPDISNVYRQWSIALSNTTLESERANWLITDNKSYDGSGTLELSYPFTDDYSQEVIYQVDVYLNSKQGARIASLQPGIKNKKVSVDYGVHYLFFNYWYSDKDSESGEITYLGWTEGDAVVINYEHEQAQVNIPVYYSNVGKYGEIKIANQTSKPISIYANDALIESITKLDGSTEGLSILPANSSTTFLIPVNTYNISAKSLDGSTTVNSFKNVKILQNITAIKTVGITYQEINLQNNTSETLLLYSDNDEYLGATMDAGKSLNFLVPASLDSIVVYNGDKSKTKKLAVSETSVNTLEDYHSTDFSIVNSWTEISTGHYKSPQIPNKGATDMSATLTNYEETTFSFNYKVSTESNYDMFNFKIDGTNHLKNISGEVGWTNFSVKLSAGTHSIQWIYEKDEMYTSGDDAIEIKDINIE